MEAAEMVAAVARATVAAGKPYCTRNKTNNVSSCLRNEYIFVLTLDRSGNSYWANRTAQSTTSYGTNVYGTLVPENYVYRTARDRMAYPQALEPL